MGHRNAWNWGGWHAEKVMPYIGVRDTQEPKSQLFSVTSLNPVDKQKLANWGIITVTDLINTTRVRLVELWLSERMFRKLNEEMLMRKTPIRIN